MTTIIGISGSLRKRSFNSALLRAAVSLAPAGTEIRTRPIVDIPLYNHDVETAEGVPEPVEQLKNAIAAADGLLICTPEYNNSLPGVLKNAIDWLSRPPDDIPRVFGGLPVMIVGASPGRFGTVLSQNAWLPVMRTLGARLWSGGRLMVSGASKVFDADGELVDEEIRERLRKLVGGFAEFAAGAGRRNS
ncbi:MAG TPA: NADPH-dependent FMN reductase [Gammaproteobacteria bacterium]